MKKLGKLAALLVLLLIPAVAQHQAEASSTIPCPSGCGYKYDPATRCCNPDPRFDCVNICF